MSDKNTFTLNMGKTPFKLNELHLNTELTPPSFTSSSITLIDGPFYANGSLHLGHFANKVFKDAFVRTNNLFGNKTKLQITSDQHGLPIEIEVEKKYGKTDNFVAKCREYANEQFSNQLQQLKKFGVLTDEDTVQTASFEYEAYEMSKLYQLYKDGKLVRLLRPVNFCSHCNSSLADAEVEYYSKKSHSLTVEFKVDNVTSLLVWTTTPYTLFYNKAVAYNNKFTYVKWEHGGKYYITVKEMFDSLSKINEKSFEYINLEGLFVESPITKLKVPVLNADYVESSGTGLVHIAPNFGLDDYRIGVNYGLDIVDCIDNTGKFKVEPLLGLTITQASEIALDKLSQDNLIYQLTNIEHNVGHCWRHKTPLFFKASKEWFLDLSEVQEKYKNENYTFYPPKSSNRLQSMIDSRKLWCISRNRKWGVPLPFFYDENDNVVDDENLVLNAIDEVKEKGVESWHINTSNYIKSTQVADVWFDSGIMYDYYKSKNNISSVVLAEGSDQHRGWFNSTVCTNLLLGNYNNNLKIFTHGFVVDDKGLKFSKSNKNYVDLDTLFKQYSPDLLRLVVLSQNIHQDICFSKTLLTQTMEEYKKIRNTFRFVLQNYSKEDIDISTLDYNNDIFNIIKFKFNKLFLSFKENGLTNLNYYDVCKDLHKFAVDISIYFDYFKDSLYCDDKLDNKRLTIVNFLKEIADNYAYLVSTIMPFTANEYWQMIGNESNINNYDFKFTGYSLPENIEKVIYIYEDLKYNINQVFNAIKDDECNKLSQFNLDIGNEIVSDLNTNSIISLSTIFGVANVNLIKEKGIIMTPFNGKKCPRCWNYHKNYHNNENELCVRCITVETNLKG